MIVALLLSLAEVSASSPETPPEEAATPSSNCAPQASDEVVVCGSRNGPSPYRLPKVATGQADGPRRAAINIAPGVQLSADVGSSEMPGAQGVALMAKIKIKF